MSIQRTRLTHLPCHMIDLEAKLKDLQNRLVKLLFSTDCLILSSQDHKVLRGVLTLFFVPKLIYFCPMNSNYRRDE